MQLWITWVRMTEGLRALGERVRAWSWAHWAGTALRTWWCHPGRWCGGPWLCPQGSWAGSQGSHPQSTRPTIGPCLLWRRGPIRRWEEQRLHAWKDVELCQPGGFSGPCARASWQTLLLFRSEISPGHGLELRKENWGGASKSWFLSFLWKQILATCKKITYAGK